MEAVNYSVTVLVKDYVREAVRLVKPFSLENRALICYSYSVQRLCLINGIENSP